MNMDEVLFLITAILFLVTLHYMDYNHRQERQDLLNRIMSRDIVEYKTLSDEEVKAKRNRKTNPFKDQIRKTYQDYE